MRRQIERVRRLAAPYWRLVLVLAAVAALAVVALGLLWKLRMVTVVDANGRQQTLLTASQEPNDILRQAGINAGEHDRIEYALHPTGSAQVVVRRTISSSINADGQTRSARFVHGTVADLMEACKVQLGPEDFVTPAPETPLYNGLTVEVNRVTYAEETRREELPDAVVEGYRGTMEEEAAGFLASYNDTYDVTYRDCMVNGLVVSTQVLWVEPTLLTRPADSYTIEEGVPCSRIQGYDDVPMGADGLPKEYTSLMENAICTAYSSRGGKGSSGLGLYCGTVAVDPRVIPYGTRMFITSADGSFIYGFAIATDTGIALQDGRIDLDLYFETNAECLKFGKRKLNVYILD